MDNRIETLAKNLVNYSCSIKKDEKVLISYTGTGCLPLVKQLIKEVYEAGGLPFTWFRELSVHRELLLHATKEQLSVWAENDLMLMGQMDAYIGIHSPDNPNELSDVCEDNMKLFTNIYTRPVHLETRLNKTKWVVLRYPNAAMAVMAQTSQSNFEDFYYHVCNLDYKKMGDAMDSLVDLMNETDKVRITGKGTDLSFSIKDIPVVKCCGLRNIPDGEIYTAPVKDSVNGVLTYNTPSEYRGVVFENIQLKFKDGKIVEASSSNHNEKLQAIFDTDDGARYIGEFALGVNPYVTKPMLDTLFDEKISGSFHFTPGNSYEAAPNGNSSSIHWDLVCIQTESYGGGEIYFDDVCIRKDGIFIHPKLLGLNPDNLK